MLNFPQKVFVQEVCIEIRRAKRLDTPRVIISVIYFREVSSHKVYRQIRFFPNRSSRPGHVLINYRTQYPSDVKSTYTRIRKPFCFRSETNVRSLSKEVRLNDTTSTMGHKNGTDRV